MSENTPLKDRLFGAILLLAGCSIGAGMLGLPIVSAASGFIPSACLFVLVWLFMLTTGLYVLEVNLWFRDDTNFTSMAERTLGRVGKYTAAFLFLFLFYCLMVAYIDGTGSLLADIAGDITGEVYSKVWMASLATLFLAVVLICGTHILDLANRWFMLGLAVSYLLIIFLGFRAVRPHLLGYSDWSFALMAVPVMVISFGFHNLVPSIAEYLEHNKRATSKALVIGSLIPLAVYIIWDGLIMGLVPAVGLHAALDDGSLVTRALKKATEIDWIVEVTEYFAFFALATSFFGQALSLVDFLADGLKVQKVGFRRVGLVALAVLPPFVVALLWPNLFLAALNSAGGFSAVLLFGLMPALMVWSGRYRRQLATTIVVPGGKVVLLVVMVVSAFIFGLQMLS